jgi:hypothetical protein
MVGASQRTTVASALNRHESKNIFRRSQFIRLFLSTDSAQDTYVMTGTRGLERREDRPPIPYIYMREEFAKHERAALTPDEREMLAALRPAVKALLP